VSSAVVSGSTTLVKDSMSVGQREEFRSVGTLALERVLPARVDGGDQSAHVSEEVQRLPSVSRWTTSESRSAGRAGAWRRARLPPVLVLPALPSAIFCRARRAIDDNLSEPAHLRPGGGADLPPTGCFDE
jgi:hypothetical protein